MKFIIFIIAMYIMIKYSDRFTFKNDDNKQRRQKPYNGKPVQWNKKK